MALPELIANSPVPGTVTVLTTLKAELKTGSKELEAVAAAPLALQAAGQFRIVLGNEILLIEGPSASGTKWKILERAAEGSTEAAHAAGTSVYHYLTAAALKTLFVANGPTVNDDYVLLSFGDYTPPDPTYPPGSSGSGIATGFQIGATVNDPTEVYLLVSEVANGEGGAAVAVYGQGTALPPGGDAWGGNLIGTTNGPGVRATGLEVDFAHNTRAMRAEPEGDAEALGITIQYLPHGYQGVNPAPYIQLGLKQHTAKQVTFEAKLTKESATLEGITNFDGKPPNTMANLAVGQELSGTGVPPGTKIIEVKAGENKLVMSATATVTSEETVTSTEVPLKVALEGNTENGSGVIKEVTNFTNLSPGLEITGPGIPAGAVIALGGINKSAKTISISVAATATASKVKLEALGKENMGCMWGIRFLGEPGASLISPEGTAIAFQNIGTCKYGIDFETNTFTGSAIHFGKSKNPLVLALGEAELEEGVIELGANKLLSVRPKVTGSKGGNAALTSLMEKLAELGIVTNETT